MRRRLIQDHVEQWEEAVPAQKGISFIILYKACSDGVPLTQNLELGLAEIENDPSVPNTVAPALFALPQVPYADGVCYATREQAGIGTGIYQRANGNFRPSLFQPQRDIEVWPKYAATSERRILKLQVGKVIRRNNTRCLSAPWLG